MIINLISLFFDTISLYFLKTPFINSTYPRIIPDWIDSVVLFPIILVGKKHYQPLFDWILNTLSENKLISREDMNLINLVEDKEEVETILNEFFKENKLDINFE